MEVVLKPKTCFMCGFKFKVFDLNNWVCNKCYYREIPKYNSDSRRKKLKKVSFGQFEAKDPELIALIIEEAKEKHNVKTQGEKKYRDFICESLSERGVDFTTELSCENGRIDIFINEVERKRWGKGVRKATPPEIIEVKISNLSSHLTSALGQLLFYSQSYPTARLYVATPQPLSQKVRKIFGLYKIEEWPENKTDSFNPAADAAV